MDPATVLVTAVTVVLILCGSVGSGVAGYLLSKRLLRRIEEGDAECEGRFSHHEGEFTRLSAWTQRVDDRMQTLENIAQMRADDDIDKQIEGRA